MERESRLAENLRRVGFDLDLLTEAQRIEVFTLARSAQVELWHRGLRWPSSPGADQHGGGLTRIDVACP